MHGFVDPPGMICALWEVQRGCCFHCDKPMIFLRERRDGQEPWAIMATREHVYPKATGGKFLHNNVVLAHAGCNNIRGCADPTPQEITKASAIYMIMGMTPFVPFSEWNKENFQYGIQMHRQAQRFTDARQRVIGLPFIAPKMAEIWPR